MADSVITRAAEQLLEITAGGNGEDRFARAEAVDVAVEGGSIRVYHLPGNQASRPVVFVSGWGTVPQSFHDFFGALFPETDLYHVETREKSSSTIARRRARFDMHAFAEDVRTVMETLGLPGREPVLAGTCFGSAVVLHGLACDILDAPTVICVDPMTHLWMPRWIIRWLGPVVPAFVLRLLRPLIRGIVLAGMREPVQRRRTKTFIDSSTVWKWRRAAMALQDWNLFDHASRVDRPVHVVNGSKDRFHDADAYPDVARALPRGRFLRVPVGEHRRERLMGVVVSLFAAQEAVDNVPSALQAFLQDDQPG